MNAARGQPPIHSSASEPARPAGASGAAVGPGAAAQRWLGVLALGERALAGSTGVKLALWLARFAALGYGLALLYTVRPLPGVADPLLELGIGTLSWCAGLVALVSAGRDVGGRVTAVTGLLRSRGLSPSLEASARPLALASWVMRHLAAYGVGLAALCLATSRDPGRIAHYLAVAAGICVYFTALSLGLALLTHLSSTLSRAGGGRLTLVALVGVPQLVQPAWPELPTVLSGIEWLMHRCLAP